MNELIILAVVMLATVSFPLIIMVLLFRRFYRLVPPGKILVRTGHGGLKVVPTGGVFVIPAIHRADLIHAEVEVLNWEGREILTQVGNQPEEVIQAFHSFGERTPEEVKCILHSILQSANGNESALKEKLAEVGYRVM